MNANWCNVWLCHSLKHDLCKKHGLELHAYLIKEINDREKKEDEKWKNKWAN